MGRWLYHYTTADAFTKMLDIKQKSKSDFLTFWASNVFYLNDPQEMVYVYEELLRILPEIENDLNLNGFRFSMFNGLSKNDIGISIRFDEDILDNIYNRIYKNTYAISFSTQKDYLPMWSLYGHRGAGLCLGFSQKLLLDYIKKSHNIDLMISKIEYGLNRKVVREFIKDIYLEFYNSINDKEGRDIIRVRREFISLVLLLLSSRIKNPSYSYEHEVRLLDQFTYIDDVSEIIKKVKITPIEENWNKISPPKVRTKDGFLIPYKEIDIPVQCLKSIVVGPTMNSRLQCEALRIALRNAGIDKMDIVPSLIPYRE